MDGEGGNMKGRMVVDVERHNGVQDVGSLLALWRWWKGCRTTPKADFDHQRHNMTAGMVMG